MSIEEIFNELAHRWEPLPTGDGEERLRALAVAVLEEGKGYYEAACGEHCTSEHTYCAMKEYDALRARIEALGS